MLSLPFFAKTVLLPAVPHRLRITELNIALRDAEDQLVRAMSGQAAGGAFSSRVVHRAVRSSFNSTHADATRPAGGGAETEKARAAKRQAASAEVRP